MTKYRVILTRDTTESVTVDVEAESVDEAEQVAADMYRGPESALWAWEADDWAGRPYPTAVYEIEEVEDEAK